MSLEDKLGEELFEQVQDKLGEDEKLILNNGDYVPRDRLNDKAEKVEMLEEQIEDYKQQLETLKEDTQATEELEQKIEELQEKNEEKEQEMQQKLAQVKKEKAVETKLLEEGAKHQDLLLNQVDFEELEIDDGEVTNIDEVTENLKENYEDLFEEEQPQDIGSDTNPGGGENDDTDQEQLEKYFGI